MLNIDNKFEIGQEVYIVQKAREDFICPACNGDGYIIVDMLLLRLEVGGGRLLVGGGRLWGWRWEVVG